KGEPPKRPALFVTANTRPALVTQSRAQIAIGVAALYDLALIPGGDADQDGNDHTAHIATNLGREVSDASSGAILSALTDVDWRIRSVFLLVVRAQQFKTEIQSASNRRGRYVVRNRGDYELVRGSLQGYRFGRRSSSSDRAQQ